MRRTILLADDSLTIQKVVELTFADTDYEVIAVSSGDELMQRLPEVRPALVICDVIMPGRDGYDVCQEIKSSSEYLHLPVILLTGTFEPFDRDRAIAVGCSEIITKPFEAKKMVDAVERLVAAPAAPAPGAVDTQSIGPEDLGAQDVEHELDDTEVSEEFGPGEAAAEPPTEEQEAPPPGDEVVLEAGTPEEGAGSTDEELELGAAEEGLELETMELPEVEAPSEADEADASTPDPAKTLAAQDLASMMDTEEVDDTGEGSEPVMDEEPFIDAGPEEQPFPAGQPVAEEESPESGAPDSSLTTPIDVAAVMSEHESDVEQGGVEEDRESPDDSTDDADTQDFSDKPQTELAEEGPVGGGLSDEDVDRIARRLLELAGDRIEHIAWDVIPDMAEVVVRERMRELEAEAGHEPS